MALIKEFVQVYKESNRVHGTVECGWLRFQLAGRTYLQLDTYGSDDRQIPGKVSQSLQLDEDSAAELLNIVREVFPAAHTKQ
jgi:hypothetical protein